MTLGAGKYSDAVTALRNAVGLGGEESPVQGGGVLVIIVGGNKGASVEMQADQTTMDEMPATLIKLAVAMARDLQKNATALQSVVTGSVLH